MSVSRLMRAIVLLAIVLCAFVFLKPRLARSYAHTDAPPVSTAASVADEPEPTALPPQPPTSTPVVTSTATATVTPIPTPTSTPTIQPLPTVQVGEAGYGELISDSFFLYSPSVLNFNVQRFLDGQPGPLKDYQEELHGKVWTAAEIIAFNAINFGVNPQAILVALEAQGNVISDACAPVPVKDKLTGWPGFYTYVRWLTYGALTAYDGARYGEVKYQAIFDDQRTIEIPQGLNAGTTALEIALARSLPPDQWSAWVQGDAPLYRERFRAWFGNPYAAPDAVAAPLALPGGYHLPFQEGDTWFYTGGPHSYDSSGARPWSSLDFVPPENLWCPGGETPANRWVAAAADGVVIQSGEALVVIDHGDGWRTYYSHVAADGRVPQWKTVVRGEPIGHPSCEVEPGGSTNGVHVHFAIWRAGLGFVDIAGLSLTGWLTGETSHYNGTLTRDGVVKRAEDSRVPGWNDVTNQAGPVAATG